MIHDVTMTIRTTMPESTVDRIKRMKGVANKVWMARYIPIDTEPEVKLEDIPF